MVNELAVLKTTLKAAKVATLRSHVRLGENVEIYGFPAARGPSIAGIFRFGSILALTGTAGDARYIQTSTPIDLKSSGAPLLDQNGAVVGLVSATLNQRNIVVATNGEAPQNGSFAIKGSLVASFLDSNRIPFAEATGSREFSGQTLEEQARVISISVRCE
jgi:S1-C subfamily serine protease